MESRIRFIRTGFPLKRTTEAGEQCIDYPPARHTLQSTLETPNSTSLTLIDRIKVHDKEAWERLVTLYTPFLHYWCRRWGVSRADADDVLQEVFQAISQNLKDFRREQTGHSFRGWLRGIARNKALSLRRRHNCGPKAGPISIGSHCSFPTRGICSSPTNERAENEAIGILYEQALKLVRNEFEDRTWQAFWRAVVDGQAPAIIAEDLGVTAAAVRQAKSRVLRRLKVILGESTDSAGISGPGGRRGLKARPILRHPGAYTPCSMITAPLLGAPNPRPRSTTARQRGECREKKLSHFPRYLGIRSTQWGKSGSADYMKTGKSVSG